jgi:Zn ribbon nucleic-acid-binding protein
MTDYRCDHGRYAMGRDCPECHKEESLRIWAINKQKQEDDARMQDCQKRAHAFIQRSESAEEVTLPGWLARKVAGYILFLEKRAGVQVASNTLLDGRHPPEQVLGGSRPPIAPEGTT